MTEIISFGMTGREILSLRNSQLLLTAERGKLPHSITVFANTSMFHSLGDVGGDFYCWCLSHPKMSPKATSQSCWKSRLYRGLNFLVCLWKHTEQTWWVLNGQHREYPVRDPLGSSNSSSWPCPGQPKAPTWQLCPKSSWILAGEIHRGDAQKKT